MKVNFSVILSSIMFISCSLSKDKTSDVKLAYSEYRSKKFRNELKKKYHFSENEINSLINLTDKNFIENGKKKLVRISASHANFPKIVNQNYYGLFEFNSSEPYPNFFFLRTENSIVYFNCNDKEMYRDVLTKSLKINDSVKSNINSFITNRCLKYNNMNWINGRVF